MLEQNTRDGPSTPLAPAGNALTDRLRKGSVCFRFTNQEHCSRCPSQRQSAELVRRVRDAVNRLGTLGVSGESALALGFTNGSRVIALPGSESTIRGYTAGMVILDEAARLT